MFIHSANSERFAETTNSFVNFCNYLLQLLDCLYFAFSNDSVQNLGLICILEKYITQISEVEKQIIFPCVKTSTSTSQKQCPTSYEHYFVRY